MNVYNRVTLEPALLKFGFRDWEILGMPIEGMLAWVVCQLVCIHGRQVLERSHGMPLLNNLLQNAILVLLLWSKLIGEKIDILESFPKIGENTFSIVELRPTLYM